jgi:hypothetical protein
LSYRLKNNSNKRQATKLFARNRRLKRHQITFGFHQAKLVSEKKLSEFSERQLKIIHESQIKFLLGDKTNHSKETIIEGAKKSNKIVKKLLSEKKNHE